VVRLDRPRNHCHEPRDFGNGTGIGDGFNPVDQIEAGAVAVGWVMDDDDMPGHSCKVGYLVLEFALWVSHDETLTVLHTVSDGR
jgi:hypothetical protein